MTPRSLTTFFKLAPLACACLLASGARTRAQEQSQSPSTSFMAEVARGTELYRQGNYKEAAQAFKKAAGKKKDDPDAWHFLSLSYAKLGKSKDALKASEHAVLLSLYTLIPKPAHDGEDYQKLSREEKDARRLKFVSDMHHTAEIVEDYLRLGPSDVAFWQAELANLRFHAEQLAKPSDQASVLASTDVDQKAKITARPEPSYTEQAKGDRINGTTRLRLILAADGTVQHILVISFLPEGLTNEAIKAAQKIKFTPAMKDGHAVSQFATIEYNFSVT